MRFSLAVLGLVAAVSATTADANVDAKVNDNIDAKVNAKVDATVNANIDAKGSKNTDCDDTTIDASTDASINAHANGSHDANVNGNVNANINGHTDPKADANVNVHVNGNDDGHVDAKADANVNVHVNGNDDGHVDAKADANVNVHVNGNVNGNEHVDPKADANVNVHLNGNAGAAIHVDATIQAEIDAAIKGFACPSTMAYCSWTKSCGCEPGMTWSGDAKACVGTPLTGGAWPEPQIDIFGSVNVELAKFCAISPTKICGYDAAHEYCQASLDTITFVADAKISPEIKLLGAADIDVNSHTISPELKSVCAGLYGLYLEHVEDAIELFNTKVYGFDVVETDITAAVKIGSVTTTQHALCKLGLGSCQRDCVAFSQEGCANFLDIDSMIGNQMQGLNGLCILPSIILNATKARLVVSVAVEHLLCIVGRVTKTVLSAFDCHCK